MDKKGFTLIELVMTIAILGLMAWIGISAILTGIDTWSYFSQRKEIMADARLGLNRMCREIRMVKDKASITSANSIALAFTGTKNNAITFSFASGAVSRAEDAVVNTLLSNVSGMSFTYYDSNDNVIVTPVVAPSDTNIRRVRINLVLSKGESQAVNMRSEVWPRNLK